MADKQVLIELEPSRELKTMAAVPQAEAEEALDLKPLPDLPGVEYHLDFPPVEVPGLVEREDEESFEQAFRLDFSTEPSGAKYVVRADVDEEMIEQIRSRDEVSGVFADPVIEPCLICPGSPPEGSDADVERLLCTSAMHSHGMDGSGVLVAIVDTGINVAHLESHGKNPHIDVARSWVPAPGLTPGDMPVDHGTMCAYDVLIAAPQATLLDVALLSTTATGPTVMSGFLSDALRAYRHLIDIMLAPRRPGEARSLVVNNSWGMFHPSWDFPVGDPGNYSDNPNHPFNLIVADLEAAGADILFAAGNCGANCPDGRCQGVTSNAIYGANGHPAVLSVAGVDVTKTRVGYSTIGPGRLTHDKPDISGYTHFRGSGVYAADGGTSAATPVVSGVVAAVRTKRPFDPASPSTRPAAIRSLLTSTAEDLGGAGYDLEHGYGVVDGCALDRRFRPFVSICKRYPWLCRPWRPPYDLCRRYPWLCQEPQLPPKPPIPPIPPIKFPREPGTIEQSAGQEQEEFGAEQAAELADALGLEEFDAIEASYILGWMHAQAEGGGAPPGKRGHGKGGREPDCGCGG